MGAITYDYIPTSGSILTSAGLNGNFYKTTAGKSIHETGNGRLEFVNFDPAFRIRSFQVRPGQAGRSHSVGKTQRRDYFSDLWTGADQNYIALAGCSTTFYTEYDVSLAMFFVQGFFSIWRQFGADGGAWANRLAAPDISIRTFFSDSKGNLTTHVHAQRDMPQTVFLDPASGAAPNVAQITMSETRLTRYFNLSHPRMVGGASPCDQLLAGEHTFGMAILVKKNLSGQDTANADEQWQMRLDGAAAADARPLTNFQAVQRASIFSCGVTATRLL